MGCVINTPIGRYHPRVVDSVIEEDLSIFGGVLITGPKWCGKTWTGINHARSMISIDDRDSLEVARLSPNTALSGDSPRLVDEWQRVPDLWDAARHNIDYAGGRGMYIFTGSAVPPENSTFHAGTGRFVRVKMRPMSLFESGDSTGSASLSKIFETGAVDPAPSSIDYEKAVWLICRGGWPASLWVEGEKALRIPQAYVDSLASSDTTRTDLRRRDPLVNERLLRSLARNSASPVKTSVISADASGDGQDVSDASVRNYMDALKTIFAIEEQGAWMPSLRSRARVRTAPKMHFADPSLAAAAMKTGPAGLKMDAKTTGLLFESLCYRDLSVYASSLNGNVYHYRDSNDLEADAIVELADGRWGVAEVKLGHSQYENAASNLLRLKESVGEDAAKPSFLMILTATGGFAYTRPDGICVVPIDCLGP
jgi:predicted AAA+ superfamily ATPase